jgi:hypothetical protein
MYCLIDLFHLVKLPAYLKIHNSDKLLSTTRITTIIIIYNRSPIAFVSLSRYYFNITLSYSNPLRPQHDILQLIKYSLNYTNLNYC